MVWELPTSHSSLSCPLGPEVSRECSGSGVAKKCPQNVPQMSPECLQSVWDTLLTLLGHFVDTPEPGARSALETRVHRGRSLRHHLFQGHSRRHFPGPSGPKGPREPCDSSAGSEELEKPRMCSRECSRGCSPNFRCYRECLQGCWQVPSIRKTAGTSTLESK